MAEKRKKEESEIILIERSVVRVCLKGEIVRIGYVTECPPKASYSFCSGQYSDYYYYYYYYYFIISTKLLWGKFCIVLICKLNFKKKFNYTLNKYNCNLKNQTSNRTLLT